MSGRRGERQQHGERGAAANFGTAGYASLVPVHDNVVDGRQAESAAGFVGGGGRTVEALEHARAVGGGDAASRIGHFDPDLAAILRHGEGHDAGLRILDGVVHEVADYLEDEKRVCAHDDIFGRRDVPHLHMIDGRLHFRRDAPCRLRDVHPLHVRFVVSGEVPREAHVGGDLLSFREADGLDSSRGGDRRSILRDNGSGLLPDVAECAGLVVENLCRQLLQLVSQAFHPDEGPEREDAENDRKGQRDVEELGLARGDGEEEIQRRGLRAPVAQALDPSRADPPRIDEAGRQEQERERHEALEKDGDDPPAEPILSIRAGHIPSPCSYR